MSGDAGSNLEAALEHYRAGRRKEAERLCRGVLGREPGNLQALEVMIALAYDAGRWGEAAGWLEKALILTPGEFKYEFGLANVQMRRGRWEKGREGFAKCLAMRPGDLRGLVFMGVCLQRVGREEEAKEYWRRALEIDPEDVDAHFQLGWVQLLDGQWEEGLKHYEWREKFTMLRHAGEERKWDGEEIGGKTVLLYAEQGVGDCLQFIRYAPLVAERGGRVVVRCQDELLKLVRKVEGVAEAVGFSAKEGPGFDVKCPLLSLPRLMGTRVGAIPWRGPYLRAEGEDAAAWRGRVGGGKEKKVGLVWAGNPRHPNDWERSMSLGGMGALAKVKGVRFYSLQMGQGAAEARIPPLGMELVDLTSGLKDFGDTAALMENLDMVIGVDTAVVHLAGAMGKSVWTMVTAQPDWRWLRHGSETGWYPTMRLFRQKTMGEWGEVLREVEAALRQWAG